MQALPGDHLPNCFRRNRRACDLDRGKRETRSRANAALGHFLLEQFRDVMQDKHVPLPLCAKELSRNRRRFPESVAEQMNSHKP